MIDCEQVEDLRKWKRKNGNRWKVMPTGCWVYQGRLMPNGYGMMTKNRKSFYAHRFYFEQFTGRKIPPKMTLDHICRNRACINPEHLEIVTRVENIRRAPHTRLSAQDVALIRLRRSQGAKTTTLSKDYGVSRSHICNIVNGKAYLL